MANIKATRVCNATNTLLKYNWHFDPIDIEAAIELGLQSIENYQKYAIQIAKKFSHFQDFNHAFTVFINKACSNYNQKIQLNRRLTFKQAKDYEQMFLYFIQLYISIQFWKIEVRNITNTSKLGKNFVRYFIV